MWIGGGEVSKASVCLPNSTKKQKQKNCLPSPFSLLALFYFPFFLNTTLKANASDKRQAFARKERLVLLAN